jgi:hypothetical protein
MKPSRSLQHWKYYNVIFDYSSGRETFNGCTTGYSVSGYPDREILLGEISERVINVDEDFMPGSIAIKSITELNEVEYCQFWGLKPRGIV